jgi:hypothetical protein
MCHLGFELNLELGLNLFNQNIMIGDHLSTATLTSQEDFRLIANLLAPPPRLFMIGPENFLAVER